MIDIVAELIYPFQDIRTYVFFLVFIAMMSPLAPIFWDIFIEIIGGEEVRP